MANIDKASACHKERRKIRREETEGGRWSQIQISTTAV
jgi:hypothetical protein